MIYIRFWKTKLGKKRRIRLYGTWASLKHRCLNKNDKSYKYYGGRGITLCEEWLDYEPFLAWSVKNGYQKGLTIDRINNDGNYEPSNCRWTTWTVQNAFKRLPRSILFQSAIDICMSKNSVGNVIDAFVVSNSSYYRIKSSEWFLRSHF